MVPHRYDPPLFSISDRKKNLPDLSEMALYPCAYSLTFSVTGNRLNALLNQRSQDMLVANNWNVCQYAALLYMFAQVSGLVPGELVHVIASAHIYDRHIPIVKEILKNPVYDAPVLKIDPGITDFYAFKPESFKLEGYKYSGLKAKIPVAV